VGVAGPLPPMRDHLRLSGRERPAAVLGRPEVAARGGLRDVQALVGHQPDTVQPQHGPASEASADAQRADRVAAIEWEAVPPGPHPV